jgi:adenylate cyclase class 2
MQYEVEQKHRVDIADDPVIRLASYGAHLGEPTAQTDRYFAHPCRDFVKTDEALRIRIQGDHSFVTYKGPKLDKKSKTRQELELLLHGPHSGPDKFTELLHALGFKPVATVRKNRRISTINYSGHAIEVAYDIVDELGVFVELELKCDKKNLDEARQIVSELAVKLDLGPSITRSYLEMLLDKGKLRPTK